MNYAINKRRLAGSMFEYDEEEELRQVKKEVVAAHRKRCEKGKCDAQCRELIALNTEDELRDIQQERCDEGG